MEINQSPHGKLYLGDVMAVKQKPTLDRLQQCVELTTSMEEN